MARTGQPGARRRASTRIYHRQGMTDSSAPDPAQMFAASERWPTDMVGWGIPEYIIEQAPESPWFHEVTRFAVDDSRRVDTTTPSYRWAREVLPPTGGTVLDIGCGGGRSSIGLAPPASEIIGVDSNELMLAAFADTLGAAGVARRTVHGIWPDVAPQTPRADLVVCHHVIYNVADIAPFLWALTEHARLAVVVELTTVHPMSAWSDAWRHFWGLERPDGPGLDSLVAVVKEMGFEPEVATFARRNADSTPVVTETARRRLCLSADRDAEIEAYFEELPVAWPDTIATLRWPGAAEPTL